MATIGSSYPTLIDMHKGTAAGDVIEILSQYSPILDDAVVRAANMGTFERTSIRTGLPTVSWGRLYKGTKQSKATMQQVDDTTGILEARSEVDVRLLKLADEPAKMRLVESGPFLEAMTQTAESALFYSNTLGAPEQFQGFAARYTHYYDGPKVGAPKNSAAQVVNGGGTGNDNTSIWFITWGDHASSLIHPKNVTGGVTITDKGEEPKQDDEGNTFYVAVTIYEWHIGLTVKDWRYNVRIANIDTSAVMDGQVDLWDLLRQGYYRLHSRRRNAKASRIAIYMNSDMLQVLDAQSSDRALTTARENTASLSHASVEGKEVPTYRGIPIRETDALLNTEALVPAYVA